MNSTGEKTSVGNGSFVYFNDDGQLDIYYYIYIRYPVILKNASVLFIDCTENNWKVIDANGLYVSIFLNNMGW